MITKQEKKRLFSMFFFLIAYALISSPITDFVNSISDSPLLKLILGGTFLFLGFYFFDLK